MQNGPFAAPVGGHLYKNIVTHSSAVAPYFSGHLAMNLVKSAWPREKPDGQQRRLIAGLVLVGAQ
jgi:hypothetical protein